MVLNKETNPNQTLLVLPESGVTEEIWCDEQLINEGDTWPDS